MANRKKQIKLTQDGIRRMISEAIKSYSFNGEGFNDEPDDKFDVLGNPKYPGGIFSTDSEEGEAFKERAKKYDKPEDNELWNQREMKLWADTHDSLWDTDKKLDKMARDEFGDEEEEGQLYDKPFGDLDDTENQWADEPGYEEEDEDDNIAGLNEGKITLTEEGLRNFISYSVARLLKEAYDFQGKEITLSNGESDGFERSEYGSSDVEVNFTDWMDEAYLDTKRLILKVNEENGGKFSEILSRENSPEDSFYECIAGLPEDAFVVCLDFTYEQGMKGDGYLQPDDEDSLTINKRELKQPNANNAVRSIQDPTVKELVIAVIKEWVDWVDEEYIKEHIMNKSLYEERNLGVTFHSNGEDTYKPENPYGDMTWDEYVEAKSREHEKEKEFSEPSSDGKNLGITFHSNGKGHEKTPEEMEDEKHMFDDNYWARKQGGADKIDLSRDELSEMIRKAVTKVLKEGIDWRKFGRDHDRWLMNNPYDNGNVWTKGQFYDTKDDIDEKDFLNWLHEFDPEVFDIVSCSAGNGNSVVDVALNNGIGWDEIVEDFYGDHAKPEKRPHKPSTQNVARGMRNRKYNP